jgi:hypothetical protein
MNHSARRIVLLSLAVLGVAGAAFAVRRPLLMSAPTCLAGRWHGCYDTEIGVLLMTLVAVPLAALAVWALAAGRRAAGVTSAWQVSLAEVGMVYGTVPFVWMTMMPGLDAGIAHGRVSLVPLRDLVTMGALGIGGNLLVLASLGFFAPMRFAALASLPRILALGVGCSVLIETCAWIGCPPWMTSSSTPPAPCSPGCCRGRGGQAGKTTIIGGIGTPWADSMGRSGAGSQSRPRGSGPMPSSVPRRGSPSATVTEKTLVMPVG